ncbi:hypothetical protein JCM9533A_40110 [Catenuloplanes niger JCM 9533]
MARPRNPSDAGDGGDPPGGGDRPRDGAGGPGRPRSVSQGQDQAARAAELGRPRGGGSGDGGAPGSTPDWTGPPLSGVGDRQFGKKWGKHAKDYGLDPSDPEARRWFEERIHTVHATPDEVRVGPWNPQRGGGTDYQFYRQGNDLLITKGDGSFVTMFPLGPAGNGWYNGATVVRN